MFLNETYDRVRVGKHLSGMLPVRNVLKHGDALSPLLFKFALDMPLGGLRQDRRACNRTVHISVWFWLMMFTYWMGEYILYRKAQKV